MVVTKFAVSFYERLAKTGKCCHNILVKTGGFLCLFIGTVSF